ncbi:hypothetical protein NT2_04_03280 [Caenibius tardaugens NBRC 16725]|uniref:Pole-organizing protein PopZ n=1 Tax=Caenibius tardaugens NBRC 16725 TaxID=1219035 RepID=U2YK62_9SPHN|nr:DUF2497 domain-containing protein [Caenibius tardaugens]AZI36021.1 DUF2497 domain-containing protein [Caenibius tardaugens NBRC 16725]GAD48915.1 hypothetical protein NT2_04_03280 [Caenibius tardaugens NBRC 16725]
MRQENEPSVEEILESIKKVIARDNRDAAAQQRRQRENTGIPTGSEESATIDDNAILELGGDAELLLEHVADDGESLVNAEARSSMRESLAALAMLAEPGVPPQIVRSGETSLEGLVREMLRPMLADWLDKNLPGMVENLVAAEIARIAGKKG